MSLSLGNMITAQEAKDMLNMGKAVQQLKLEIHQAIVSLATGVTIININVPKSISAAAVPVIETEGYTVTRTVLASGSWDQLEIDWSNPT